MAHNEHTPIVPRHEHKSTCLHFTNSIYTLLYSVNQCTYIVNCTHLSFVKFTIIPCVL